MATTDRYTIAGSLLPMRNCMRFLGGNVDDGVTINGLAAAAVAADHTHGTISAWIMIPDLTGTYSIVSMGDNDSANEYLEFTAITGKLKFKVVDGGVTRVDVSTTSVVLQPHKWYHVALVQNAIRPQMYVNGEKQALTYTTSTEVTQWLDDTDGIDNAAIGALYSNNAYTQEFAGYISDVKIWSGITAVSALSREEIIKDMTSTPAAAPMGHYKFNGDVLDKSSGTAYNGTIVGDLIYCQGCEFTSRLTFGVTTPVVADKILITCTDGMGLALVIKAA